MGTKKMPKQAEKRTAKINFKVKKTKGAVFIEGFANAFTVDRGEEIIETDAWDLENFSKNPVILVEHGMHPVFGGLPVGKASDVKMTDKGLTIKARISNSQTDAITMIRDLVEEGMVQAFSVGFNPKGDPETDDSGVKRIKSAELFEVSLVGIPMNQDSLFDVSSKAMATKSMSILRRDICRQKGALLAAALHQRLFDLEKDGGDRTALLEAVANEAEVSKEELDAVLLGNVQPSDAIVTALSSVLGVTPEQIADVLAAEGIKQDEEDEEEEAGEGEEEASEEEEDKPAEADEEADDEEAGKQTEDEDSEEDDSGSEDSDDGDSGEDEEEPKRASKATVNLGPADKGEPHAHRAELDSDGDGKTVSLEMICDMEGELDPHEHIIRGGEVAGGGGDGHSHPAIDESDFAEKTSVKADFQACVAGKIPILIEEGMDQDEAVAAAIAKCREAEKCAVNITNEQYRAFFQTADEKYETWTSDNTKQAEQDVPPQETVPFNDKVTDGDLQSPVLDLMKQTNVLLGQLVGEIQGVRAILETSPQEVRETETEEDEEPAPDKDDEELKLPVDLSKESDEDDKDDEEEDENKSGHIRNGQSRLDNVRKRLENYRQRLTNLNRC